MATFRARDRSSAVLQSSRSEVWAALTDADLMARLTPYVTGIDVDGDRWRRHLLATATTHPGIVPVIKGNGYGLGVGRLARRAQWLSDHVAETGAPVDLIAIGTYDEIGEAATRYAGDLLVLTPWRPFGAALDLDDRTAARVVTGLPSDAFVVLLTGGSLAFGGLETLVDAVLAAGPEVTAVALCGHDERLQARLAGRRPVERLVAAGKPARKAFTTTSGLKLALGRLPAGRYVATVTATDAAGNRAAPVTVTFRVR